MLVLSRKLNQKVLFPDLPASVEVVSVRGAVIRLGIEAPPRLTVLREEIVAAASTRRLQDLAFPADRAALAPETAHGAVARLEEACARLAWSDLQRASLPPEVAAALARVEADLRTLCQRLLGQTDAAVTPPVRSTGVAGQRRTALLVEDNPNERELLATFLRMAGLRVDTAGDGADALGYLHTHARPDVILLDMGMPRCDGPTAVRAIRHDPALAGVKIVAVTGHAAEEFDLARGPAGVDRWFQKPIEPGILVQELEREFAAGEGRS